MDYNTTTNANKQNLNIPELNHLRYEFALCFDSIGKLHGKKMGRPFPVLIWPLQGEARTSFDDTELGSVTWKTNQILFVPANSPHTSVILTPERIKFLAFAFSAECPYGLDYLSYFSIPIQLGNAISSRLKPLLRELYAMESSIGRNENWRTSFARLSIGYSIYKILLDAANPRPDTVNPRNNLWTPLAYLNKNFDSEWDLEKAISLSNMSRTHFFRCFKIHFGMTPGDFVMQKRMRKATALLREGHLRIGEIAQLCGWPDQFYFSRRFKSAIGISPEEYRKRISTLS